jgi:UDP-N-acetylmuramate dehydrogenase
VNLETLREAGITLREGVALAERTTLKIGGPARLFAEVPDATALSLLLAAARREGIPVLPLGKGSNVLFDDEGFDGVVIVLSGAFRGFAFEGDLVRSGAGVSLVALAAAAGDAGLSGLEGLSGIPSSVGGAIRINAGSYGTEIFDLLVEVESVSRSGERRTRSASAVPHGYRWSALAEEDDVVTAGSLRLSRRAPEEIRRRLEEVAAKRRGALPRQPNAGSVFRNPPGGFA